MRRGDLTIRSIPGGVAVSGADPDVDMDDLVDAMFEGFLRSEGRLRAEGKSHFRTREEGLVEGKRELTFGEKAVGLNFNPSGDETVTKLKTLYAEIIDICHGARAGLPAPNGGDQGRLWSIAITEAQGAQMWAVKSATWKDE